MSEAIDVGEDVAVPIDEGQVSNQVSIPMVETLGNRDKGGRRRADMTCLFGGLVLSAGLPPVPDVFVKSFPHEVGSHLLQQEAAFRLWTVVSSTEDMGSGAYQVYKGGQQLWTHWYTQ